MRFGTKATIMAALAGPAIAGLILTGAGPANAAVATPHTTHSSSFFGHFCSRHSLELWNLNGDNTIDNLTFKGSTTKITYAVHFRQRGCLLGGTLTDTLIPNGPQTGPITGQVRRNHVTFSFTYTYTGEVQGTRTFSGFVAHDGTVSGTWSETGPEAGFGTWSLATAVPQACPPFFAFAEFEGGCPVPFFFFGFPF